MTVIVQNARQTIQIVKQDRNTRIATGTASLSPPAGAAGPTGGAFAFEFDGASQTMADPGDGLFRLNHATPASATAMALSAALADASDVSALIVAMLAGSSAVKARIVIATGSNRLEFDATGVTDNADWLEIALTGGAIVGALGDEDPCEIVFLRKGDKGDTPSDAVISSDASVTDIVTVTQAAYDALDPPDATTLYVIVEA